MNPSSVPLQRAATPSANPLLLVLLGAVLIFCICGVGAFALLNAMGVVTTQVNLLRTPTPTTAALVATTTPTPSLAPTSAPSPSVFNTTTATPTATTIPTSTPAPVSPSPPSPGTFVAFDADFFVDACPLFEGSNETRAYGCDFGEYYMRHKQAATRYSYYDVEYDDAVVEATGYFNTGSGKYEYGVVVRGNTDGTQYYVFTVTNEGKYNVALYKDGTYTDLIPYTPSNIVNTGAKPNTFRVVMYGTQLVFYLNDQFIAIVPDNVLGRGVVGLFFYNDTPNTEVGFDQLTISTFTPPTATPDANSTPTNEPKPTAAVKPGVYINSLRLAPLAPQRGQPVTFFATFFNSTGRAQSYRWRVEIWEADANKKNPFGDASGLKQTIPVGTYELATGDSWKLSGGGPCTAFRARVVFEDDQARRVPFKRTNGADLWVPFQVCP